VGEIVEYILCSAGIFSYLVLIACSGFQLSELLVNEAAVKESGGRGNNINDSFKMKAIVTFHLSKKLSL
jgi:hypothetical protein